MRRYGKCYWGIVMNNRNQVVTDMGNSEAEFETRHDAIADRIFAYVKHDLEIIYQAYNDQVEDNLDDIPIDGKLQIRERDFSSEILDSPTWLELSAVANEQVKATKGFNNRYLKDIKVIEEKDGIKICQFLLLS